MPQLVVYHATLSAPYRQAWHRYNIRLVALIANMVCGAALLVTLYTLAELYWSRVVGNGLLIALCGVWLSMHLLLSWWYARFTCPRCGKRFHLSMKFGLPYGNFFAWKCLHCGLRKYARGA